MSKKDRPVVGYSKCGNCQTGRASVHQQEGGNPFLYTRFCDNDACRKKTCQSKKDEIQQLIWENLEPLDGVEIKEPPVVYKLKNKPEEKPREPSVDQGLEWSPDDELKDNVQVKNIDEEPRRGKGLALVFLVVAGGLFALARGVAR